MDYKILLDISLIVFLVTIISIVLNKLNFPKVISGILVGIILGPALLNVVHMSETLNVISQLGVISIMLIAGMSTNFKKFIDKTGKYTIISVFSIVIPFILGYIINKFFSSQNIINTYLLILIIATSESIAIETLIELKKLDSKVGRTILGVSVINTLATIFLMTVFFNPGPYNFPDAIRYLTSITIFFVSASIVGYIIYKIFEKLEEDREDIQLLPMLSLVFALLFAYFGELITGVNGVIGAYIAGLIIGNTSKGKQIKTKLHNFSYMFFIPIFSATIGLKLKFFPNSFNIWKYILILSTIIILIRLGSSYFGSRIAKYSRRESYKIGLGLAVTGDLSLIFMDQALDLKIIDDNIFTISLLSIIIVSIIVPILININFSRTNKKETKEI